MFRAKACCQIPVLALDVVDDGRARPSQKRRDHQTDAFAGSGRCKAKDMFRAIMAKMGLVQLAQNNAI